METALRDDSSAARISVMSSGRYGSDAWPLWGCARWAVTSVVAWACAHVSGGEIVDACPSWGAQPTRVEMVAMGSFVSRIRRAISCARRIERYVIGDTPRSP